MKRLLFIPYAIVNVLLSQYMQAQVAGVRIVMQYKDTLPPKASVFIAGWCNPWQAGDSLYNFKT